jgi:hypothetical protein
MESGLTDGAWKGERVFILGGGPSLNDLDPSILSSILSDEVTLGLNMAFLHNPTANLVYDKRLMETLCHTPMWLAYPGAKFWLNSESSMEILFPGVRALREFRADPAYPRWPASLAQGLYRGNNAGSAGVSLADSLGAGTIYLLGYDMRAEAGKPSNWHHLYPKEWRASAAAMASYRADLKRVASMVRAKVVNVTPDSALDAFPKDTLARVLETKGAVS